MLASKLSTVGWVLKVGSIWCCGAVILMEPVFVRFRSWCAVEAAKHENVLKISREQFTLTFLIVLKTR